MPTDPTQLPCGPDTSDITALHLSIDQRWSSGSTHNIHLLENGDLGVILQQGQQAAGGAQSIPSDAETGTIVVTLGVDGDHDEIHYSSHGVSCGGIAMSDEEMLGQAVEGLVAARDALKRVRKA